MSTSASNRLRDGPCKRLRSLAQSLRRTESVHYSEEAPSPNHDNELRHRHLDVTACQILIAAIRTTIASSRADRVLPISVLIASILGFPHNSSNRHPLARLAAAFLSSRAKTQEGMRLRRPPSTWARLPGHALGRPVPSPDFGAIVATVPCS
jgi:hypothetical protein